MKQPLRESLPSGIKQIFRYDNPWLRLVGLLLTLAVGLNWVSMGFTSLSGSAAFLASLALAAGLLLAGWHWVKAGEVQLPRWLALLLVGAAFLRLALGVFWFVALPAYGHGTKVERAGYVMADAHDRDQAAWKLSQSDKSLWSAFRNNRKVDQYGGLLFISALNYRYMGGSYHQPLQIVVLTSAFSALAVLFGWAFACRAWGGEAAKIAAWGLALYPEVVLLGSSQMREGFTVTLTAAAFYGLIRYERERAPAGLVMTLLPVALTLLFSPPFSALLLLLLGITALGINGGLTKSRLLRDPRFWLALAVLVALILAGVWLAWHEFTPEGNVTDPVALMGWWLRKSADWQAHLTRQASGWIQKIFETTPRWLHLPLLLAYGVVQPFLPAALVARSEAPIWSWIVTWRSLGWTVLLVVLLYAPLRAWRAGARGSLPRALAVAAWLAILVASLRGGADLYDNPRYRATFAALQIALAAWAIAEQRRAPDPWLGRALGSLGFLMAWFLPWYLRRYTGFEWPVDDLFKTLGLGLGSAAVFLLTDWARKAGRKPNRSRTS